MIICDEMATDIIDTDMIDTEHRIRKRTLNKWINNCIASQGGVSENIESYVSNHANLFFLLLALESKVNLDIVTEPASRDEERRNVTNCMRFWREDKKINFGKLTTNDIVDGNVEKITELVKSLMMTYSIIEPKWSGDSEEPGRSAMQKLLEWIQRKIPEKNIQNFTTDWNDGSAIGALVNAMIPGACTGWRDWKSSDSVYNATQAMAAAYKWINIPQLLDPNDLCSPELDEISMMTYLSQFPNNKLDFSPAMIYVCGPGIEPFCNTSGNPVRFVIETESAGKGEPDVLVTDPDGREVHCEVICNKKLVSFRTYNCVFVPQKAGVYSIRVYYAGIDSPKSPYLVNVEQVTGHADKVTVHGQGITEQAGAYHETFFEVNTKFAGCGVVDVGIIDPQGNLVTSYIARVSDDLWRVKYSLDSKDKHSIFVFFAGKQIPASPLHVGEYKGVPHSRSCTPLNAARSSIAFEIPQISLDKMPCDVKIKTLEHRVPVGKEVDFNIGLIGADKDRAQVLLTRPSGKVVAIEVAKEKQNGFWVKFTPMEVGPHQFQVVLEGQAVYQSTFHFEAFLEPSENPVKIGSIICFGPGLHPDGVFLGSTIDFEVNAKKIMPVDPGEIYASMTSPRGVKTEVYLISNNNGTYKCSCTPFEEGTHVIEVIYRGMQVPRSPFRVKVRAGCDPSKVVAYGPGLGKILKKESQFFIVETKGAGQGQLSVEINGPANANVQCEDDGDGRSIIRFLPTTDGGYKVIIKFAGIEIPGNPFKFHVAEKVNLKKVKILLLGKEVIGVVNQPISAHVNMPQFFSIQSTEAGIANLDVIVKDPSGKPLTQLIVNRSDGDYVFFFKPEDMGEYQVLVQFEGQDIPNTPITILVSPVGDASLVQILGEVGQSVTVGERHTFRIDKTHAGDGFITCKIESNFGDVGAQILYRSPTIVEVSYTPLASGPHRIVLMFGGRPIPNGQFIQQASVPL